MPTLLAAKFLRKVLGKILDNEVTVSFGVTSLFTSITKEVVKDIMYGLNKKTPLKPEQTQYMTANLFIIWRWNIWADQRNTAGFIGLWCDRCDCLLMVQNHRNEQLPTTVFRTICSWDLRFYWTWEAGFIPKRLWTKFTRHSVQYEIREYAEMYFSVVLIHRNDENEL